MSLSIFELFKIGIGPSSSHTVGPMWAAHRFTLELETHNLIDATDSVEVGLYGSLALTGHGHATDKAIVLGLMGETPDKVDPDAADEMHATVRETGALRLMGRKLVPFQENKQLIFHYDELLPKHSNGMRFQAYDNSGRVLHEGIYYSVGGGFVLSDEEAEASNGEGRSNVVVKYPFESADELLEIGRKTGLSIASIVTENEQAWRCEDEIDGGLRDIWSAMESSIRRGCQQDGCLPGGLEVKRRASSLYREMTERP